MKLTDQDLKERLPRLVRHERKLMALVLEHIAEVDRRRLYLDWGFSSLFVYLVQELKYSEASANRRMSAARALHKMPELLQDVEVGSLNLSQISIVQATIRNEEKAKGEKIPIEQRKEIYESVRSKNQIQTQKILDEKLPVQEPSTPVVEKYKRDDSVEVTLRIPRELFAKLKEVKDLYSHVAPGAGWLQLLDLMANDVKKLRDPKRETRARSVKNSTRRLAVAEVKVSRPIRRLVFQRDLGKCQHQHPDGSKCGSTFQVEVDHIQLRFAGGTDEFDNLQVLCRVHNQEKYRRNAGINLS